MKKTSSIFLISITLAITGCSTPNLHKPRFADYGNSITYNRFETLFSDLQDNWLESFYTKKKNAYQLKSNTIFEEIKSGVLRNADESVTYLLESKRNYLIDVKKKRLNIEEVYNEFSQREEGDVKQSPTNGLINNGKNAYKTRKYGEIVDDYFYLVDLDSQAISVQESNAFYYRTEISSLFSNALYNLYYFVEGTYEYYACEKALTIVNVSNSNSNTYFICQFLSGDVIGLKYESVIETNGSISTTWYEATMKKTNRSAIKHSYKVDEKDKYPPSTYVMG